MASSWLTNNVRHKKWGYEAFKSKALALGKLTNIKHSSNCVGNF